MRESHASHQLSCRHDFERLLINVVNGVGAQAEEPASLGGLRRVAGAGELNARETRELVDEEPLAGLVGDCNLTRAFGGVRNPTHC